MAAMSARTSSRKRAYALIAAYAAIFLLTPLAGTSLSRTQTSQSREEAPVFAERPNEEAGRALRPRRSSSRETRRRPGVRVVADRIGVRRRERRGSRFRPGSSRHAGSKTAGTRSSTSTIRGARGDRAGHISYGGLDLVYHKAGAGTPSSRAEYATGDVVEGSREILLALRFLFLGAMLHGALVTPRKAGAATRGS